MENTTLTAFNPHSEVSTTIVSLLKKIADRFDSEDEYNNELKSHLLDRLPEANWSEIAHHLENRETNENFRLKEILSPFIPKDGDRVPLLDNERKDMHPEDKLYNSATKESLQAMDMLNRLLIEYKKRKDAQATTTTTGDGLSSGD
jgi:hypothetical protein